MQVTIRKFEKIDIPKKVEWINNPANNRYLHYDLPLEIKKTESWFDQNAEKDDRFDAVIEADGVPVGLIGLLTIDLKNKKQSITFLWESCHIRAKELRKKLLT